MTIAFGLAICFATTFGTMKTNAGQATEYAVSLRGQSKRSISVKRVGSELFLVLKGFGEVLSLKATDGGVSTCRTIIEHDSSGLRVVLSLPIADPRAACRKLPGFATVEINSRDVSIDEDGIRKISGNDARLRSSVRKILGEIESE